MLLKIMEKENEKELVRKENPYLIPLAVVVAGILLSGAIINSDNISSSVKVDSKVEVSNSIELPVSWNGLGAELVNNGTIDVNKFKAIYVQKGIFTDEFEKLLLSEDNGKIIITKDNAGYLLNLFWALGLASKNPILESGEMTNPVYGGAQNFASTAGWTMSVGNPMNHYSKHVFFELTGEQQALVDRMSRGIYRPCCNNSTHFPDCNHGMAMLGLLELMASQGVSENKMWQTALIVNSFWFPDTYKTLAEYEKSNGIEWKNIEPKKILGINYSSASGYTKIKTVMNEGKNSAGVGCGV